MSSIRALTIQLDMSRIESKIDELKALFERLPDEVASEIRRELSSLFDSGETELVFGTDVPTDGTSYERLVAQWPALDELVAVAFRAVQGDGSSFHGNPSQGGFDGCGDCDSTAGADSHLFLNRPAS